MEKRPIVQRAPKIRNETTPPPKPVDSRPLKDKEFQLSCGRNVIEHLAKNFYNYPVSLQTILSPDIKSF